MNKKAIQLSINFIVMLIIAIVIFAFGINFIYNLLSSAEEMKDITLEDIDNRISNLMCGANKIICLDKDIINIEH